MPRNGTGTATNRTGGVAETLRRYFRKRDFTKTSEPAPSRKRGKQSDHRFVVQKHDARRLHFDLRLELDGVLKSWAVTKGPSMHAGVRRLAVQTEDHPIAYKDWEGTIPKGQYGGGTMIVWDQGVWIPEGDPGMALAAGKLNFELKGQRLKGSWTLVRMKNEEKRDNWLLIKRPDAFALSKGQPEPAETQLDSVLSGKTNSEIGQPQKPAKRSPARGAKASAVSAKDLMALPGVRKGKLPDFVEPSLALLVAAPPQGREWIHEIKHDGYRILARLDNGKVSLLTRTAQEWSRRFPTIAQALAQIPVKTALIDGEIIVREQSGHSSFSGLQADLKAKRHDRMTYYVFDLLHCDGVDLRGATLLRRKEILGRLLEAAPPASALRFNEHLEPSEADILSHACKLGLEGIVSKRADLGYIPGRGPHWMKSKCMLRQEFVIVGLVPATDRPQAVGSLVLAYYDDGRLRYAGRAGTGYSAEESLSLFRTLLPLKSSKPDFRNAVPRPAAKGVTWVEPKLVAEIEYRGRTTDGLVRQAAFAGLREDKPARSVVLENALHIPQHRPPVAPMRFPFTNPGKILWPDANVSKQDLGDYYESVAERLLPHIVDRPLSLLRCPDGIDGQCFFARHAWMGTDPSIRLADTGGDKPMLAIDGLKGVLSLVQMGVLEIHVWGSRTSSLETPDRLVFDLDPGEGVTWNDVKMAALDLKSRLESLQLVPFLKTTGGKGLHVVAPVEPRAEWEEVKAFCKGLAQQMVVDSPFKYVASMSKSRRKGRIFIDYLRNSRSATAIAPYSTRARAGAPVAVPLRWDELPGLDAANSWTLRNIGRRLENLKSDPWAEIDKARAPLASKPGRKKRRA